MKLRIGLLGLILMSALSIKAQKVTRTMEKHPHRTAAEAADKLSQKQSRMLGLSSRQSQQMKVINLHYAQQIDSLRALPKGEHKEKMEAIKSFNTNRNNQYKEVLTPDQFKKWNDWQLQHKQMVKEKKSKHTQQSTQQAT